MKRSHPDCGFTLVELLVVIAIISVLAAIIFPVFAGAREKARQVDCLSNQKQIGLGILQYLQDDDDAFPLGEVLYNGRWDGYNQTHSFPSTSQHSGLTWANSIQPYLKNAGVFFCKSSLPLGSGQNAVTYTYNGDMQCSTEAAVQFPSAVVMVWAGFGKRALSGAVLQSPSLYCPDATRPCAYQAPANANCAVNADGSDYANGGVDYLAVFKAYAPFNKWVHSHGDNFLYVDGHVKWQPLNGDPSRDPWIFGNADGNFNPGGADDLVTDGQSKDGCHSTLFTPDYNPDTSP